MSTISSSLSQSKAVSDTGIGKPALVMAIVFVLGLVTIAVIYQTGDPVEAPVAAVVQADATEELPATQKESTSKPTAPPQGEAYVAANGVSPLPKHGEAQAPPIPAERLITQDEYEALPAQPSTLPAPDGPVAWNEAQNYLGQTITVKGTIVETNNIGQICFLNYDSDWQDKFYIAIFKEAFDLLPDPPEEHFLNRTLLITGKITLHRDRPQIEVRDISQIEVVE
jgi:hypothetical protein